jgi:hypothetical protein
MCRSTRTQLPVSGAVELSTTSAEAALLLPRPRPRLFAGALFVALVFLVVFVGMYLQ